MTIRLALLIAATFAAGADVGLEQPSAGIPIAIEGTPVLELKDEKVPFNRLIVTLHNEGSKTIVAWGVAADVTYSREVVRPALYATDGFEYSVRDIGKSPVMQPDGSFTFAMRVRDMGVGAPRTAVARVVFAIFDDDTSVGDEAMIVDMFAHRDLERRALQLVLHRLNEAVASASGALAVLAATKASLDALDATDDIRRTGVFPTFQGRLGQAIAAGTAPKQVLTSLRRDLELQLKNAETRSVRK